MKITHLRCEYLENPLGIDVLRPRFFWQMESDREGVRQIAYRISTDNGWDSGRVESNQSTHVEYDGPALKSRQRIVWSVEAEDESGATTKSESAWFEMGLLDKNDWQAQLIGGSLVGGSQNPMPAPFLGREFTIEKTIKSARLYASALGVYETEINGQKVGDHVLAPGWTDYFQRLHYQSFDVTGFLQGGQNKWNAVLGDGWFCGHIGWKARQNYGGSPQFLGQLEIEFEDGSREVVATDGSWKVAYGPILSSDLLQGESYDARLELNQSTLWNAATVFPTPDLTICAPLAPPVKKTEEIAPIETRREGGAWIFDLGQNLVGRIKIRVRGVRGQTLKFRFAEVLEGGPGATTGPIYTANLRSARQTDFYTLKGGEIEEWEPKFTFHGFRFVEVTGLDGEPGADFLTGIVLHTEAPQTGDFECSDELLNQLQRNIDWGWRGNSLDVPTDCPQRDERLGWTGDAQVFIPTSCFLREVAPFWTEWARDVRDAQKGDGAIPCTIPMPGASIKAPTDHNDAWHDGGPAWADAVLICPWTIYKTYGDRRILEENYPTFERYLAYLQSTSRDGTRCFEGAPYFRGFGDWLALDGSGKTEGGTPYELIGTAFYAHSADLMSQIAAVLGKNDDAARYGAIFQSAKSAFQTRFITPGGRLSPPYQTPIVLALHFGLMPEDLREKAAAELKQEIQNRGGKLSTGFVGTSYLPFVLSENGLLDDAYNLLLQREWPSYLYAVTQGATTIWERWDAWTPEKGFQDTNMNSFNHYAYGAVGDWLYQVVAGIRPGQAGYQEFLLHPQPGPGLTSARAHLDTLFGRIESAWTLQNGRFDWNFVVPPNTRARAILPNGQQEAVGPGRYQKSC